MAIQTFKSISDLWRTGSTDPGIDLVSILFGAQNIAGFFGKDINVEWNKAGKTKQGKDIILLDASPVTGLPHPIPPENVDIVIGVMIHEMGHRRYGMDRDERKKWYQAHKPNATSLLNECDAIIQDAFIDACVRQYMPYVMELYLNKSREFYGKGYAPVLGKIANQSTWTQMDIVYYWAAVALYDYSNNAPSPFSEHLYYLWGISEEAGNLADPDALKKAHTRLMELACEAYDYIRKHFPEAGKPKQTWSMKVPCSTPSPQGEKIPEDKPGEEPDIEPDIELEEEVENPEVEMATIEIPPPQKMGTQPAKLNKKETQEVLDTISNESTDITAATSSYVKTTATTIIQKASPTCNAERKKNMQSEIIALRKVFEQFRTRRMKYFNGLEDGKINPRRIWRTGLRKRTVFKKRIKPEMDIALVVAVDMSLSMEYYKDLVLDNAVAFKEALQKEKTNLSILGYNGVDPITIYRLWDKEMPDIALNAGKWDGTPTAQALAAARTMLRGTSMTKIIINVTDGKPDDKGAAVAAITKIKQDGIKLIAIMPVAATYDADAMAEGYYDKVVKITDMTQVPLGLEAALRSIVN